MYKKRFSDRGGDRQPGRMFPATCANCKNQCEVPFKPFAGKPVFCRDCFKKPEDFGGSNSRDFGGSQRSDRDFGGSDRYNDRNDRSFGNDRNFGNDRDYRDSREERGEREYRDYRDDSRPAPQVRGSFRGTCNSCGDDCSVPFKPEPGRALFCPKCFGKGMNASGKGENSSASGISKEQFESLNKKLDKILSILEMAMSDEGMDDMDMDMEDLDMEEEMPAIKAPKTAKAPKAEKPAKEVAAKEEKKPTRGQKKRAIRTGKTL